MIAKILTWTATQNFFLEPGAGLEAKKVDLGKHSAVGTI